VADQGVGDWGTAQGTKGGGTKDGKESKNNANLHNEKHAGAQSGNIAQGMHQKPQIRLWISLNCIRGRCYRLSGGWEIETSDAFEYRLTRRFYWSSESSL